MICGMFHKSEIVKRGSDLAKLEVEFVAKSTVDHGIGIMVFDT